MKITVIDHIIDSHVLMPKDPLQRVLGIHELEGDMEAQEMESCLNLDLVETRKTLVEKLDRELSTPPKPPTEEAPKLEIKIMPTHFMWG